MVDSLIMTNMDDSDDDFKAILTILSGNIIIGYWFFESNNQ